MNKYINKTSYLLFFFVASFFVSVLKEESYSTEIYYHFQQPQETSVELVIDVPLFSTINQYKFHSVQKNKIIYANNIVEHKVEFQNYYAHYFYNNNLNNESQKPPIFHKIISQKYKYHQSQDDDLPALS